MIDFNFSEIMASANADAAQSLRPYFWPMVGQTIKETWLLLLIIAVLMILDGKSRKLGRGIANIAAMLLCVAVLGVGIIFSDWRDVVVMITATAIIGLAGFLWSQRWRIA